MSNLVPRPLGSLVLPQAAPARFPVRSPPESRSGCSLYGHCSQFYASLWYMPREGGPPQIGTRSRLHARPWPGPRKSDAWQHVSLTAVAPGSDYPEEFDIIGKPFTRKGKVSATKRNEVRGES